MTADVLAGGKIGTNPGGPKNEAGAPNDLKPATSDIEPSKISDVENTRLGHVETSKYGPTLIEVTREESASPDSVNLDSK